VLAAEDVGIGQLPRMLEGACQMKVERAWRVETSPPPRDCQEAILRTNRGQADSAGGRRTESTMVASGIPVMLMSLDTR
jgi:hypothetical protein